MSINDILSFLKGSVTIEVEGDFLERFLNICMRRGIYLCDIKRISERKIKAKIGIGGFREVRPIAKKTRTRVRIRKRTGMPFLLYRYKNRRFSIAGVVVFLGVLWYLSTHIMGIDIVGNERLAEAELMEGLKEFGLYRGAATSSIDRRLIQNKMMTAFDDIAWVGVNIKGSRAFIEVKERLDTERVVDVDIPCNIIAARDGIVRGLEIRSGQTIVKLNDMVEKGDLLVSGAMDSGVVGIRYAHSDGAVYAETIYKRTKEYPLEFVEKEYTGKTKSRHSLTVFGRKINLFWNSRPPFEYSDKADSEKTYHFISDKLVSVGVGTEEYVEYIPKKKKRSETDAASLGKSELFHALEKELSGRAEILSREASYRKLNEKTIEVTAEFVCKEDIAQKSVIDKTEGLELDSSLRSE